MTKIQFIDRTSGALLEEQPPAEAMMRWIYGSTVGRHLLPLVRHKVITELYGRRMNRPSSVRRIQPFIDQLGIDMTESARAVTAFTSFNDFFYRRLKPEARPIGQGFVSPGDGRLLAFDQVAEVGEFFVKGQSFSLAAFLADDEVAERYQDGQLLILRLAPNDYHRYHFPAAGTPTATKGIKGVYYSVSPIALAWHFARVFCENKRAYCILKTLDYGDVIIAPVGATMVGSIVSTYLPDEAVDKGDEMGYFAFGGSTIVLLVEPGRMQIDEDLLRNTADGLETYVKMGERIGVKADRL